MTPVLIVMIVMSFAALMAKMGMDHNLRMRQGNNPENSLPMSELRKMIQEAVQEANAPLQARMEAIEDRLERQEKRRLSAPASGESERASLLGD